jgi:hypothetical protein
MKKVLVAGMLAVAMIAATGQQVSAWHNNRFSIGLNWQHQSGGNSWLWGAYRNGQPPGPEAFGGGFEQFNSAPQYYQGSSHYHAQGSYEAPAYQNVQPVYPAPYQFATYPRPVYYNPEPTYFYYYGR